MYVENSQIIVDVMTSHKTEVYDFLLQHCSLSFIKRGLDIDKSIKFVEQKSQPKFTGERGDGLCFVSDSEIAQRIRSSSEIRSVARAWRDFPGSIRRGTLGCFARNRNQHSDSLFIITAQHIFESRPESERKKSDAAENATSSSKGASDTASAPDAVSMSQPMAAYKDSNTDTIFKGTTHGSYFCEQSDEDQPESRELTHAANESHGSLGKYIASSADGSG